jgi:hypothetical protein
MDSPPHGLQIGATHPRPDGFEREYHGNGQLKSEREFKRGNIVGMSREWYRNGVLKRETPHQDGFVHGIVKCWDPSGKLLDESRMEHGLGIQRTWRDDGSLAIESELFPDSLVRSTSRDHRGHVRTTCFHLCRKVTRKAFDALRSEQIERIRRLPADHPPLTARTFLLGDAPREFRDDVPAGNTNDEAIPGPWGQRG